MSIELFKLIKGHTEDCMLNPNCTAVELKKSPVFSNLWTVTVRWDPGKLDDIELIMLKLAAKWVLEPTISHNGIREHCHVHMGFWEVE